MLNALSQDFKSGYRIYSDYFDKFCLLDDEINVSCLKRSAKCEKTVKRHLFKKKHPLKEPAFFNFFSHHDVNRVASQLGVEIVVYAAASLGVKESSFLLHDFRSLQTSASQRQVKYFLYLTAESSLWTLSRPLPLNPSKVPFASSAVFARGMPDILLAVDRLVLEERCSRTPTAPLENLRCSHVCDLQQNADLLFERWNRTVLVVSFCRLLKRGSWGCKKRFSDYYFMTLALVTSPEVKSRGCTLEELGLFDDQAAPVVVALYNEELVCKMTTEFSEGLLARYRNATGRKEKICGRNFMENPKISASERLAAQKVWSSRKKTTLRESRKKKPGRICECSTCASSAFCENMSDTGPEQLCSTGYSVSELLKMLGSWTPLIERDLDRLCELSIASMDIESKTVNADVGSPSHGDPVEYRSIDSSKMEGYVKKVQKPLMIAHADSFLTAGSGSGTKIFTAESDSESAIFQMMKNYWNFVLERQRDAQEEKLRIARPLYELVNSYRKPFFELASEWYDSTTTELREKETLLRQAGAAASSESHDSSYHNYEADLVQGLADKLDFSLEKLTSAWRQSIPGKLEEALDRLVEQYEVFSFYG